MFFCKGQKEYQFINGLKGPVNSVKAVTERRVLKNDSANLESHGAVLNYEAQYAKFDRKGRFKEWGIYDNEIGTEKIIEKHFCKYQTNGNLAQDSIYLTKVKVYYNYVFVFDKKLNKQQKWRYTNNDQMESKFLCAETFFRKGHKYKETDYEKEVTFLYNERGDFLQATEFGESKPSEKSVYDSLGREVISYYWDDNDSQPETETYVYDGGGHVVLYTLSGSKYEEDYKEISVYDKKGNLESISTYSLKDSLTEKDVYAYDEAGNEIQRKTYDKNGVLLSQSLKKYDKRGNLVEDEYTDNILENYRHTSTATYEYDAKNNWIKKSWRDDHGFIYITTRKIVYY